MNGNIFTEFLKTNIPDTVEKFLEQNQLKLYFKYEINELFGITLQQNLLKLTSSIQENSLTINEIDTKTKKIDTLRMKELMKLLNPVCNHRYTTSQREEMQEKNGCKTYFHEKSVRINEQKKKKGVVLTERSFNPGIGNSYMKDVFSRTSKDDMDMIIVVTTADETTPLKNRILGFMITELAECKDAENRFSNTPALNLICVGQNSGSHSKFVGRVLLYMYLYALKKENHNYGLLELAGLYCNIGGLCLYNKFGFREDISIKSPTCFEDDDNLSMVAELNKISYSDLELALMSNKSENANVPDSEPLCEREKDLDKFQEKVMNRMKNYDNILNLHKGIISLNDLQDIYFENNKPKEINQAVKRLSKYSKDGNIIVPFLKKKDLKRDREVTPDIDIVKSIDSVSKNTRSRRARTGSFSFHNIPTKKLLHHYSNLSKHGYKLFNKVKQKTQKKKKKKSTSRRKK